jgi:hypothetical protein
MNASFAFIAFLDADDFYLPGRFRKDAEVFSRYADADGVYDATGVYFQDESLRTDYYKHPKKRIITLRRYLQPEALFDALAGGCGQGSFHTDGIVLRRSILERTGLFDPDLRMSQDTHLWIRTAAIGRLYPGEIRRPVSMVRVHGSNRVTPVLTPERRKYQYMAWRRLVNWGHRQGLGGDGMRLLVDKFLTTTRNRAPDMGIFAYGVCLGASLFHMARCCPGALRKRALWKAFYHASATCLACRMGRRPGERTRP